MNESNAYIYVNDIEVGSLPREQLKAFEASARRDRSLYLPWLSGVVDASGSALFVLIKVLPAILLIGYLLWALTSPGEFSTFVRWLQTAEPEVITEQLRNAAWVLLGLLVILIPTLALITPSAVGYETPFKKAVDQKIREVLGLPVYVPLKIMFVVRTNAATK